MTKKGSPYKLKIYIYWIKEEISGEITQRKSDSLKPHILIKKKKNTNSKMLIKEEKYKPKARNHNKSKNNERKPNNKTASNSKTNSQFFGEKKKNY